MSSRWGGVSYVLDGLGLNLCACSFPLQINPRLSQHGALRRLPRQHVLQQVPAVEVVGEVGFAPSSLLCRFLPLRNERGSVGIAGCCAAAGQQPRGLAAVNTGW